MYVKLGLVRLGDVAVLHDLGHLSHLLCLFVTQMGVTNPEMGCFSFFLLPHYVTQLLISRYSSN